MNFQNQLAATQFNKNKEQHQEPKLEGLLDDIGPVSNRTSVNNGKTVKQVYRSSFTDDEFIIF